MKTQIQTRIGLAMALILALLGGLAPRVEAAVTASGGNYTNDIPGYRIHVFTNSATASNFVVSAASPGDTVEVLVVGGGGGGGAGYGSNNNGGGGGGGGCRTGSVAIAAATNILVVVGAGGNGGTTTAIGTKGGDSQFGTIVATGGGCGGGGQNPGGYAPLAGGCGGGGAVAGGSIAVGAAGNTPPTNPMQGTNGGNGHLVSPWEAGGGGGSAQAGSSTVGTGGNGISSSISGTTTNYGGGGAGGQDNGPSLGGLGGGGTGGKGAGTPSAAQAGVNGLGGGGGGGGSQGASLPGANGGSGIVIVRYATGPVSTGIALQPVANMATNSAQLIATLSGTSADLYAFWDTQAQGTNFTWAYTNSPLDAFTNTAAGTTITNTATGLMPGTSYAYRFYGTNTTSGWSGWSAAGSFITPGPPLVDNSTNGASGIGVGTATLNGRVTATNGAVCYGKLFWGPADGSNNATAWAYTNDISGAVTQGVAYAVTLSNLLYGQQYYYRAAASNSYGLAWATNSVGFVTVAPLGPSALSDYVIRYTFENAGTTTVTNDGSAGATYDGTLVSTATLPTITNGVGRGGGKALSMLTGTSRQAVQIGSSASSGWGPNGGVYTLSLWFYGMYDANGYRTAFKRDWNTDNDMYITDFSTLPDAQNMTVYSGEFKNATTPFSMKPYRQGQPQGSGWHMLTFVATNAVTQMYVDGVAAGSTIPWVSSVNIGTIGGNQTQDNRNFAQYLDDVYIYDRALTSNEVTSLYQNPSTEVVAIGITNLTASGGTSTSAVLNATLQGTGSVFNVSAYYWVVGAGSSNVAAVGTFTNVASTNLSVTVTNLTPGMNYAYTFLASNAATNLWATPAVSFGTVDVNVQATDPTGRVTLADTAAFTVYRPAAATNGDLTVNYTLGGTATNGTHYTNSPAATVTNGTVTILAGQTNAVITVYPLNLGAPEQTVKLTLASGGYVIGAENSATCTLAAIGTQYYTSQTGDWTNSATWGNSGPPSSGDSGVVRHGAWNNAVLATTNLGAPGNYATITVATNGCVAAKSASGDIGTTIANPITFDGGKLATGGWNAPGGEWTGPITITTNGLISVSGSPANGGSPRLSGKVSGPGGITITAYANGYLTLNNPSNDFAGNVVVTQGWLTLACDHALPTGKVVNVYSAGAVLVNVNQTYASEPPPVVNLYGGTLVMGTEGYPNLTNALAFNVSAAGATFNGGVSWANGRRLTGPITIASGGTLNVGGSRGGGWTLDGPISGAGALRFYVFDSNGGLPISEITGTNNTHSGGTLVATFGPTETHTTIARGEGSLGTGPLTVETNTIMALDKTVHADWTLTNTLAGAGTFKVEDGSTTYRLTAGGTVSPGTNSGHTAILRVDGKFAFAQNGATPATLAIDVASVGSTPGVHHDQLTVDHPDSTLASSITNCTLAITLVPTPVAMNGQTLTILSAAGGNFAPYTFASTNGLGEGGSVNYGNGSITVTWTAQTPIINNGAFSNLAATSCDVSGYLSSTGDTPTVVRCYYGTNSPGESGWMYTNNLGTQAVGTVGTSLTGLTSNVKYYYRFYATNDVGDFWSVATSNFTTLADINWNDAASGNWNAGNANTWGAGANVYPQSALNDHVTVDSHLVTVTGTVAIVAADVALTTSGSVTGTLAFVNADVQNQAMILDGGRLGVYSDDNGTFKNVVLNGKLRVKSASQLHLGAHGNRLNGMVSTLNGNIEDYGPGTTGVLRVDWNLAGGEPGRLVYNGVSTNFTGGWLINCVSANDPMNGYFWLGVQQDGGLGASTVTVTRGLVAINATQSSTVQRPAPARVIVNPEGRFQISSGVTITNWTVDFNGGQMWWYGASKYAGGTLAMNANSTWWGATAGNKEYAGTMSGTGRLDINPTGGSGPFILSGNNSGFSGGIRLLADSLTVSHTNGLGTGPVLLASQSGGKLTLDQPSGNFDWTLANNLSGGCTNGSTAVALQVEDGAGNNTLTVLGTVDPGTNGVAGATNIVGILRVDGDLAFGAGSRLKIDINGTNSVAGVDFDRLLVDHDLTVLANAVLEITVNTNLAATALAGQELIVATNATTLVGAFGSVQWSGRWTGQVTYNVPAGTVKLSNIEVSQGTIFKFR